MRKNIFIKLMGPLIAIFTLTVIVNITTTKELQTYRNTCNNISESSNISDINDASKTNKNIAEISKFT